MSKKQYAPVISHHYQMTKSKEIHEAEKRNEEMLNRTLPPHQKETRYEVRLHHKYFNLNREDAVKMNAGFLKVGINVHAVVENDFVKVNAMDFEQLMHFLKQNCNDLSHVKDVHVQTRGGLGACIHADPTYDKQKLMDHIRMAPNEYAVDRVEDIYGTSYSAGYRQVYQYIGEDQESWSTRVLQDIKSRQVAVRLHRKGATDLDDIIEVAGFAFSLNQWFDANNTSTHIRGKMIEVLESNERMKIETKKMELIFDEIDLLP